MTTDEMRKAAVARIRRREVVVALAVVTLLVIVVRGAGIARWWIAALWIFMALWTLRTALLNFHVSAKRAVIVGGVLSSMGGVCIAMTYALPSLESVQFPLFVVAMMLMIVGTVMTYGARRGAIPR
ncbi:MAG: hypothetical protein ABJE10_19320 [bacterium]